MPRLIVQDLAQPVAMPRANPNTYGAQIADAQQATGRLTQALGQVLNEYGESRARSSAAAYEAELRVAADEISRHPEVNERPKLFEDAQRSIYNKNRERSVSKNAFDRFSASTTMIVHSDFMSKVTEDATKVIRAEVDAELEAKASQAADSDDPVERATIQMEGESAILDAFSRGWIAEHEVGKKRQKFVNAIEDGVAVRLINDDPAAALRFFDSEYRGDVKAREEFKSQALSQIRVRAEHERAEEGRKRRVDAEAAKAASEAAEESLIEQWHQGGLPFSAVEARKGDLSSTAYLRMARLSKSGLPSSSGKAQRVTKLGLYEAAISGEDVADMASEAVSRGDIFPKDRAAALSAQRQPAYRPARQSILSFVKTANDIGPANADKAIDQFEEWAAANPEAPAREADKIAHEIMVEQAKRMPKGSSLIMAVYEPGTGAIDVDATLKLLDDRLAADPNFKATYSQELTRLMKVDKWQQYRAGLEAP